MKKTLLILAALLLLWPVQYLLVVPLVWLWKISKILGLGMLLVFVPVIGWIILALKIARIMRGTDEPATYARPWIIDQIREA